eukprot:TRINITY_DN17820_c0_g1_i1.p1 TRINITY_DN17820_c0_g1~~TRINITY_DN17820_c0_g1_i1.p1  ORF type:complete len:152 (-),score=17.99 TRINITY_DN17820_c0_g1_i1:255-710(-)
MLLYLILVKPFDDFMSNIVNTYNELVILLTFGTVLLFNMIDVSTNTLEICGWTILVLMLISLILAWGQLLPPMIMGVVKMLKGVRSKSKGEAEDLKTLPKNGIGFEESKHDMRRNKEFGSSIHYKRQPSYTSHKSKWLQQSPNERNIQAHQ